MKKPLSRLQSARLIIDYYDDFSEYQLSRLPKDEQELYYAALDFQASYEKFGKIISTRTRTTTYVEYVEPERDKTRRSGVLQRTPPEVQKEKQKRTPSKLVEYFRGSKPRRYPPRKSDPLFQSMYEHMDDLEELLDEENAEEAEEQGNSKEMWFEKTHSVYAQGKKIVKKIERKKKSWKKKKTKKSKTGKRSISGMSSDRSSKRKRKIVRKRS